MKLLPINSESSPVTRMAPEMELISMHYWPRSRGHTPLMTMKMYVAGFGEIEFKDGDLSEATKEAISRDAIASMQRKMGY